VNAIPKTVATGFFFADNELFDLSAVDIKARGNQEGEYYMCPSVSGSLALESMQLNQTLAMVVTGCQRSDCHVREAGYCINGNHLQTFESVSWLSAYERMSGLCLTPV